MPNGVRTTVMTSAGLRSSSPTSVMISGVAAAPNSVPGPQTRETTTAAITDETLAMTSVRTLRRLEGVSGARGCAGIAFDASHLHR